MPTTTKITPPGLEDRFRRRLKAARKRLRMSQADVAWLVAPYGWITQQQTIARIEAGDRAIGLDEAAALASVLRMSLIDMISPENQSADPTDVEHALRDREKDAQLAVLHAQLAASEKQRAAVSALLAKVAAAMARKVDEPVFVDMRRVADLIPRDTGQTDDSQPDEPAARARVQRAPARQPRTTTKKGADSGSH